MEIEPEYKLRFINESTKYELINLYHLALTALSGTCPTKYQRMIWACKEYHKKYPAVSSTGAYKDLCGLLGY